MLINNEIEGDFSQIKSHFQGVLWLNIKYICTKFQNKIITKAYNWTNNILAENLPP